MSVGLLDHVRLPTYQYNRAVSFEVSAARGLSEIGSFLSRRAANEDGIGRWLGGHDGARVRSYKIPDSVVHRRHHTVWTYI